MSPILPVGDPCKCLVSKRADRELVDAYLKRGDGLGTLSKHFGIHKATLGRHRRDCLGIRVDTPTSAPAQPATPVHRQVILPACDRLGAKVYFIQSGGDGGPVKIGWTMNLRARRVELQTGNPQSNQIIAAVSGGRTVEAYLHNRFQAYRRGKTEWFDPAPELMAYIDGIVTATLGGTYADAEHLATLKQGMIDMGEQLDAYQRLLEPMAEDKPGRFWPIPGESPTEATSRYVVCYRAYLRSQDIVALSLTPEVGTPKWFKWATLAIGEPPDGVDDLLAQMDHGTNALRRAHWGEFTGDHYAPPDDAARDTILAALAADDAQPPETT